MSTQNTAQVAPIVFLAHGQAVTTSLEVARYFGKRHDDVLKKIRALLSKLPPEHARNFAEMFIDVELGQGATRKDPAYELTRDGFTLLAMGFTGTKALEWKCRYMDAFNAMEARLRGQPAPISLPAPVPTISRILLTLEDGKVVKSEPVPEGAEVCSIAYFRELAALRGFRLISPRNWLDVCEVLGMVGDEHIPALLDYTLARRRGLSTEAQA